MKINDVNGKLTEGWYNVPPIDRERYGERSGLEGPFQTKAGKVVYYDPREGAYYDPDSDIYLTYDEWQALNEGLPPHLAKFVNDQGDWTDDAKARLGKSGAARLAATKRKSKDVTPKGYGPDDVNENDYRRQMDDAHANIYPRKQKLKSPFTKLPLSKKSQFFKLMSDLGAEFDPNSRSYSLNGEVVGYEDYAGEDEDRVWYNYYVLNDVNNISEAAYEKDLDNNSPIIVTGVKGVNSREFRRRFPNMSAAERWIENQAGDAEIQSVYNESENLSEDEQVHATYLVTMSKSGREDPQYIKVDFVVPSWGAAHPQALRKQIDNHPEIKALRDQGYINQQTIASWKGDLDSELAAAQNELNSGKKFISGYESDLKQKVRSLTYAKNIMSTGKVKEDTQLDELSPTKLSKYKTAAASDLRDLENNEYMPGAQELAQRRRKGLKRAGAKLGETESGYVPTGKRRPTQKDWYHMLAQDGYALDPNGIEQETMGDPGYESSMNVLNFTIYNPEGYDIGTGKMDDYFGIMRIELHTGQNVTIDNADHPLARDAWSILNHDTNESQLKESFKSASEVDAWVKKEFGGDFAAALDHAIDMANLDRNTVWNRIIKYLDKKTSGQNLKEYKPGVTTLTRELSFADTAGTQFDIHDPDAEYAAIKKIRWPYGIDVKFNDRTRTVRFKTAKMKTVAKILDKHIDFGAISAAEALDLPPELMSEDTTTESISAAVAAALGMIPPFSPTDNSSPYGSKKAPSWEPVHTKYPSADDKVFMTMGGGKGIRFWDEDHKPIGSYKEPHWKTMGDLLDWADANDWEATNEEFPGYGQVFVDGKIPNDVVSENRIDADTGLNRQTQLTYDKYYNDIVAAFKKENPTLKLSGLGWAKNGNISIKDMNGDTWEYNPIYKKLKLMTEGMPSSVIKHKQKYANMSDPAIAAALGDKSEEQLRQMAWRHGYGKMSDHYVRRVAKGKNIAYPIGEADTAELTRQRNAASGPLADKRKEKLRKDVDAARKKDADEVARSLGLKEAMPPAQTVLIVKKNGQVVAREKVQPKQFHSLTIAMRKAGIANPEPVARQLQSKGKASAGGFEFVIARTQPRPMEGVQEGKTTAGAAVKRAEASRQRAIRKAKSWMKRTGKDAAAAAKEFDIRAKDLTEDSPCWDGYEKVPGKKDYEKGSCRKR